MAKPDLSDGEDGHGGQTGNESTCQKRPSNDRSHGPPRTSSRQGGRRPAASAHRVVDQSDEGEQGNADTERSGPAGNSLERIQWATTLRRVCGRLLWGACSAASVVIGGRDKERESFERAMPGRLDSLERACAGGD
ncbi:hypothetical protein BC567DRAFT_228707 [Phyllosticta citribraziliensis]